MQTINDRSVLEVKATARDSSASIIPSYSTLKIAVDTAEILKYVKKH